MLVGIVAFVSSVIVYPREWLIVAIVVTVLIVVPFTVGSIINRVRDEIQLRKTYPKNKEG